MTDNLGNEMIESSMHADGRTYARNGKLSSLLEATNTRRDRMGLCFQRAVLHVSTQLYESLLCDVETCSGSVDGGKRNRFVGLLVVQPPALAAIGGTPLDVECATDIWEHGEILEMRVTTGETVGSVGACNAVGVAVFLVVRVIPRDFIGGNEGLLDVVIRGVVQVSWRGSIATCRHGTSNVREEECEDECSEVDHCETAGV
jgi:hypothetical protein